MRLLSAVESGKQRQQYPIGQQRPVWEDRKIPGFCGVIHRTTSTHSVVAGVRLATMNDPSKYAPTTTATAIWPAMLKSRSVILASLERSAGEVEIVLAIPPCAPAWEHSVISAWFRA